MGQRLESLAEPHIAHACTQHSTLRLVTFASSPNVFSTSEFETKGEKLRLVGLEQQLMRDDRLEVRSY